MEKGLTVKSFSEIKGGVESVSIAELSLSLSPSLSLSLVLCLMKTPRYFIYLSRTFYCPRRDYPDNRILLFSPGDRTQTVDNKNINLLFDVKCKVFVSINSDVSSMPPDPVFLSNPPRPRPPLVRPGPTTEDSNYSSRQ